MQSKANVRQTLWVLLIALVLAALCIGGLWAYVKNADALKGQNPKKYVVVSLSRLPPRLAVPATDW
jgi:hypothetical protein